MDALWDQFVAIFENTIDSFPYYKNIIHKISNMESNILFYSCKGFPLELIWNAMVKTKYGCYTKTERIWEKQVIYNETPYYFDIDIANPNQSRNLNNLANFIKEIVQHPCIHSEKHIFFIRNIDCACDKENSPTFRVLLERYSKNAIFICTTYKITALENPIKSRFLLIRVPHFKPEEIKLLFNKMNVDIEYHPLLEQNNCTNIYFCLYIAYLSKTFPETVTENFCLYNLPIVATFLQEKTHPTMNEIRQLTQKISVYDVSFSDLYSDLSQNLKDKDSKRQMDFISKAAEIDYMCSKTEGYRKPLYIEYLLHIYFYGLQEKKK